MAKTILITGGTGTIGRRLIQFLQARNHTVALLSRSATTDMPNVRVFQWDIKRGNLDPQALATADAVIHLAGAGIADERWSDARKKEIIESRTKSTELLVNALKTGKHAVKAFVSSSAIGFYGGDTGEQPLTETSPAGNDFLAQVTRAWEKSVEPITTQGIRTVRIRTGVVLTMAGGALPKLAQPVRLGAGAPIGSGQQYISWIHLDDLCRMYVEAVENERWEGVYNGVAPGPATNADLTKQIAHALNRPMILPNIPAFVIKLMFGELAVTVLGGNYVLNKRIREETDFRYQFGELDGALADLLKE